MTPTRVALEWDGASWHGTLWEVEATAVPFALSDLARLRTLKQSLTAEVASARELGVPEAEIKEAEAGTRSKAA